MARPRVTVGVVVLVAAFCGLPGSRACADEEHHHDRTLEQVIVPSEDRFTPRPTAGAPGPKGGIQDPASGNFETPMMGVITVLPEGDD